MKQKSLYEPAALPFFKLNLELKLTAGCERRLSAFQFVQAILNHGQRRNLLVRSFHSIVSFREACMTLPGRSW